MRILNKSVSVFMIVSGSLILILVWANEYRLRSKLEEWQAESRKDIRFEERSLIVRDVVGSHQAGFKLRVPSSLLLWEDEIIRLAQIDIEPEVSVGSEVVDIRLENAGVGSDTNDLNEFMKQRLGLRLMATGGEVSPDGPVRLNEDRAADWVIRAVGSMDIRIIFLDLRSDELSEESPTELARSEPVTIQLLEPPIDLVHVSDVEALVRLVVAMAAATLIVAGGIGLSRTYRKAASQ